MRLAILASPKGCVTVHTAGVNEMRCTLYDRVANDEAFPGEIVVRLPRRVRMVRRITLKPGGSMPRHEMIFQRWTGVKYYPLRRFLNDSY